MTTELAPGGLRAQDVNKVMGLVVNNVVKAGVNSFMQLHKTLASTKVGRLFVVYMQSGSPRSRGSSSIVSDASRQNRSIVPGGMTIAVNAVDVSWTSTRWAGADSGSRFG